MVENAGYYLSFMHDQIKQFCRNAGVPERKMRRDLGKSGGYIRSIPSGQSMPSVQELCNLCRYLNVIPEIFITWAESNMPRNDIINRLQSLNEVYLQKISLFLVRIAVK